MENKDFRYRLNNHKVPMNEASWDKMQMLLEADKLPEKKNKRRYFFWWLFFGLLLVGAVVLSNLYFSHSKNVLNDSKGKLLIENNSTGQKAYENSEVEKVSIESSQPYAASGLEPVSKSGYEQKNKNIRGVDLSIEESLFSKNDKSVDADNKVTFEKAAQETIDIAHDEIHELEKTRQGTISNKVDGPSIVQSKSVQSTEEELLSGKLSASNVDDSSEGRSSSSNSDQNNNRITSDQDEVLVTTNEVTLVQRSNMLPLEQLLSNNETKYLFADRAINEDMIITNPNLSKWLYFGQLGYAQINSNPGLIFGAGLQYQLDRILHIESSLTYTYGNEAGVVDGEPRTEEREIDLGLVVHFNLLSNEKSRFAFEVGYGLTKYWGQRIIRSEPITIDDRSSLGAHYQGGLSYTYKVNRKNQLSLKLGVVGYDDSLIYMALKYYKRI